MTQKLLTLPIRVGFSAARTALEVSAKTLGLSAKLAGTAVEILRPGGGNSAAQAQPSAPAPPDRPAQPAPTGTVDRPASKPRPPAGAQRVNGRSAADSDAAPAPTPQPPSGPPVPLTPPAEQPDTPLSHEQERIKTLEDEDEVVAEFAEPGAEDGAGAQLDVQEPWEGYAHMNAGTIIARIDQAGPAELALLELYEQTHKKRQTVLGAANRRLRALSPPQSE